VNIATILGEQVLHHGSGVLRVDCGIHCLRCTSEVGVGAVINLEHAIPMTIGSTISLDILS
jgi:hypothetical protein